MPDTGVTGAATVLLSRGDGTRAVAGRVRAAAGRACLTSSVASSMIAVMGFPCVGMECAQPNKVAGVNASRRHEKWPERVKKPLELRRCFDVRIFRGDWSSLLAPGQMMGLELPRAAQM